MNGPWSRVNNSPFSRFLLVGALNTGVAYGFFVLFVFLKLHYVLASVLSFALAVTNSYLWNKYFTFRIASRRFGEILKFFAVYAVQYLIGLGGLVVLVEWVKWRPIAAQTVLLVVMVLFSFFAHKHWTFKT
jgi:putative flippase GtrA